MNIFANMNNDNAIQTLTLGMLPCFEHEYALGKDLILADTEDYKGTDLYNMGDVKPLVKADYPFKLEAVFCLICKGGTMTARVNMTEHTVHKNDLMILMPGEIVQCLSLSRDFSLTFVGFSDSYYFPLTNGKQINAFKSFFSERPVNRLGDELAGDLLYICDIIRRRIADSRISGKENVVKGYINALICDAQEIMESIMTGIPKTSRTRSEIIFTDFISLLEQNYTAERTIGFYASELCLTPAYLSQVVLEQSGKRASEWIKDYVLLEAKALLATQRHSVQEVADHLHFANQSFFGTWFKKATGISPRQYQQNPS